MQSLKQIAGFSGLIAICIAAVLWAQGADAAGLLASLIGGGLIVIALRGSSPSPPPADSPHPSPIHWPLLLGGLIALLIVGLANAGNIDLRSVQDMNQHTQFAFLLAGLIMTVRGIGGVKNPYPAEPRSPLLIIPRNEWLLIGGITVLALLIRALLTDMPLLIGANLNGESASLYTVIEIWRRPGIDLLSVPEVAAGSTWMHGYLTALTVEIAGRSLFGLRLLAALAGAATVPAVWWLGRHLSGPRVGLLAALLLATFPPHLHLSWLALPQTLDPVFGVLGLAFIARGAISRIRMDFAIGGALLGVAALFGGVGAVVFPVIGLLWLTGMWWWRRVDNGSVRAGLLTLVAAWSPLLLARWWTGKLLFNDLATLDYAYWRRVLDQLPEHMTHVSDALATLVITPDAATYPAAGYLGAFPLLLAPLTILFVIGVWVCIARRQVMLVCWLLLTGFVVTLLAIPGALDWSAAFPAMALLAAIGLHSLDNLLPRHAHLLPVGVGVLLAVIGAGYYVGVHLPDFQDDHRATREHRDFEPVILHAIDAYPRATRVHLLTESSALTADADRLMLFLRDDIHIQVTRTINADIDYFERMEDQVDNAIFLPPDDTITLTLAREVLYRLGENPVAIGGEDGFVGYYHEATEPTPSYFYARIEEPHSRARNQMVFALVLFTALMWQFPRPFWVTARWRMIRDDATIWAAGAVMLALLSGLLFMPAERPRAFSFEIGVAVGSAVLAGICLLRAHGLWSQARIAAQDQSTADRHAAYMLPTVDRRAITGPYWLLAAFGAVLLAFVSAATVLTVNVAWIDHASHHVQLLALVGGIGLIVRAMIGRPRGDAQPTEAVDPRLHIPRWEWLLLLAICAGALLVRVYRLNTSITAMVDEVNFISGVLWYWEFPDVPLMEPMSQVIPFPRLYNYLQSVTMAVFGRDFLGFRAASALTGAATVAATWWLARHLFDRRLALFAALVLATLPPHVHFSRIALNNIVDPLFGTLTFAYIARGLLTGKRVDFVLAGLMFGLTQYFFEAGRLLYPPILLVWLGWVWLVDRHRFNRVLLPHLLPMLLVAVVVAAPVYVGLYSVTGRFAGRLAASGLSSGVLEGLIDGTTNREAFLDGAIYAFLAYVNRPEIYIFYGGTQPLVLMPLVPLFLLGLWQMAARAFWPGRLRMGCGALLIGLWVFATAFANMFLVQSFTSTRFVVAFPAIAILIAAGVYYTIPLLFGGWQGLPVPRFDTLRLSPRVLTAGIFLLITVGQTAYYFGPHLDYFNAQFREVRGYRDVEDAVLRSLDFPDGTQVHLITEWPVFALYPQDILRMLRDNLRIRTMNESELEDQPAFFANLPRDVDQAVYIVPGNEAIIEQLEFAFADDLPEPQFSDNPDVPADEQYALYYIPSLSSVPPPGLTFAPEPYPAEHNRELPFVLLALGAMLLAFGGLERALRWLAQRPVHGQAAAPPNRLSTPVDDPV